MHLRSSIFRSTHTRHNFDIAKISSLENCPIEITTVDAGSNEDGFTQIGSTEIGSAEIGFEEISSMKIGVVEIGFT